MIGGWPIRIKWQLWVRIWNVGIDLRDAGLICWNLYLPTKWYHSDVQLRSARSCPRTRPSLHLRPASLEFSNNFFSANIKYSETVRMVVKILKMFQVMMVILWDILEQIVATNSSSYDGILNSTFLWAALSTISSVLWVLTLPRVMQ